MRPAASAGRPDPVIPVGTNSIFPLTARNRGLRPVSAVGRTRFPILTGGVVFLIFAMASQTGSVFQMDPGSCRSQMQMLATLGLVMHSFRCCRADPALGL